MLNGEAAELSRKCRFRSIAEKAGVPIPPGTVCHTPAHLQSALQEFIDATGAVIVKQDLAGGGEGNVAFSLDSSCGDLPGAYETIRIVTKQELNAGAEAIWASLVDARNTCLIVESYVLQARSYYAEVDTRKPGTEVINKGYMRMDPTWVGFEYPMLSLADERAQTLVGGARSLGQACLALGYRGLLNCDAIDAGTGIHFHEINVRHGGCSHIDAFCRKYLGPAYDTRFGVVTDNRAPFRGEFQALEARLESAGLGFHAESRQGVAIMTEDLNRSGTFEYLAIADTHAKALTLEADLLAVLRGAHDAPS